MMVIINIDSTECELVLVGATITTVAVLVVGASSKSNNNKC